MGLVKVSDVMASKVKGYDKYEVKSAVDTLQRAKEIESDPAFMAAVEEEAARQAESLKTIVREKNSNHRNHI